MTGKRPTAADWPSFPVIDVAPGQPRGTEPTPLPLSVGSVAVTLAGLHQTATYAGVLCGMPVPGQLIADALDRAAAHFPAARWPPAFLPPVIRRGIHVSAAFGALPWFGLPAVTSTALLTSPVPVRDPDEIFSCALVVWWQDGFGPPGAEVSEGLARLSWTEIAWDTGP